MMDAISQPPFSAAGERFVENMSSSRNKLITLLLYWIKQNPTTAPSANPCRWPPMRRIGAIHWINALGGGGGKRLTTVMMFVVYGEVVSVLDGIPSYSCRTSTKPTVQEIFVPARTQIGVFLLMRTKVRNVLGKTTLVTHYSYRARG